MNSINPFLKIEKHNSLTVYRLHFKSLTEIEYYLKQYPQVNGNIFYTHNSETNPVSFAGAPLDQAIRYLFGGYDKDFPRFLKLKREMDSVNVRKGVGRKVEAAVVGSRPNVPGYIAGAPKTMYRMQRTVEKKFVDVYMNISYPVSTTDEQILNRGILVLNLITLLENNDLGVNFRVFQSSYVEDEVFFAEVVLKKPEDLLNVQKCYYPMCGKEFLRRVLARVLESVPVKRNWGMSYGMLMNEQQNRSILEIPKDAIMILSPGEMGIYGKNIYEDADRFLNRLNLSDRIRFPKYVEKE